MNRGQRQVIAEKISSTVRVLELLGFEYEVSGPKNIRLKGNTSPRIVHVKVEDSQRLWVGNSPGGLTFAFETDGKPIPQIKSIEDLYEYLKERQSKSKNQGSKKNR